jgi:polyphosphate kinase 2
MARKNKAGKVKRAAGDKAVRNVEGASGSKQKDGLTRKKYEEKMFKLHTELVKMQAWIKQAGGKVIVVFEGRDAAGKGGVIKRITERVSPRVFKVVALATPTEREKSQMYMQRFVPHFPAAGEVVIFDRSWYNRAGVERVMGFCSESEYKRFLKVCPYFERLIADYGIILIKYWFEVSQDEQTRRFEQRIKDARKFWKLSPMDLESHRRWYDYSRARDAMFASTDSEESPWYVVKADDKRRARLNCIAHLLSLIPYKEVPSGPVKLPKRHRRVIRSPITSIELCRRSIDARQQVAGVDASGGGLACRLR